MRSPAARKFGVGDLLGRIERMDSLPIRPLTARQVMGLVPDELGPGDLEQVDWSPSRGLCDLDPGWALGEESNTEPLALIVGRPWWSPVTASGTEGEALQRMWRHAVAVSIGVRWLARESGESRPEALVRAGLLHGLARWALAAADPGWLVRWLDERDPEVRRRRENSELGITLDDLGRRLAERWGCDPLIVDAAWLHASRGDELVEVASTPAGLAMIRQAYEWAECTPWSIDAVEPRDGLPVEPRLRILVAEVQSRCGSPFTAPDAGPHEERMTRLAAGLRIRLAQEARTGATRRRLLQAMAEGEPSESAEAWADRAGRTWCAEPEITAARVVWSGVGRPKNAPVVGPEDPARPPASKPDDGAAHLARRPDLILPLRLRGKVAAEVQLWTDRPPAELASRLAAAAVLPAWEAWALALVERGRQDRRVDDLIRVARRQNEGADETLRDAKLLALAEFAAGAGHELNNPLAVIVGRAQLLLGRCEDAEMARSLRIILGQAQRTHRILRDLMFVARPPAPRPRACRPAELLRGCIQDAREECEARGIELADELDAGDVQAWADPEALKHLADILIRNAIQATPPGGRVHVRSSRQGSVLRWWVCDSGKGISPAEGAHLFDPFFCGRQAGRGLGMGLPRAARIVAMSEGSIRWSSAPGQGTVFQVQLPLSSPPEQSAQEARPAAVTTPQDRAPGDVPGAPHRS